MYGLRSEINRRSGSAAKVRVASIGTGFCKDWAAGARDPIDSDAWLKLAEEWLALANANEAARNVQNSPTVNERPASE